MKFTPILKDFQAKVQSKVKTGVPTQLVERADQVLLSLSHSGSQLLGQALEQTLERIESNPHDLVGRVGRQVLQRAEDVRMQLVGRENLWVPSWLSTVKFVRKNTAKAAKNETADVKAEAAPIEVATAKKTRRTKSGTVAKTKAATAGARKPRKTAEK